MRRYLTIILFLVGLIFIGWLFRQFGIHKRYQYQRFHCLDGTHWKGHYKADPVVIDFADGYMTTTYLANTDPSFDHYTTHYDYECGKDGNIYYNGNNWREYFLNGNKMIGTLGYDGKVYEEYEQVTDTK